LFERFQRVLASSARVQTRSCVNRENRLLGYTRSSPKFLSGQWFLTGHNNSFLSLLTIQNIFSINISNKSSPPKPFHSKIPLNCNQQQQLRLQYTDCKVLNIAAADVDGWTEYFTTI